jgi:hypothetical protein
LTRSCAYFINGGAGRVIASIPAFEKLFETDKDFVIVCEGGSEIFRGHPDLDGLVYDHWHKGVFNDHIKNRDIVTPEPYRVWEYYNQKCNLVQAFDIAINNKGVRKLPAPSLYFSKMEIAEAYKITQEIKAKTGLDKIVVIQPYGRGVHVNNGMVIDPTSRSIIEQDLLEIVESLRKEYAVILMSEVSIPLSEDATKTVVQPRLSNLRVWAAIIELSDHFVGCDSVGQHIARALEKTATLIIGSTFPINVSYIDYDKFDIVDLGEKTRKYSPIRISMEDQIERNNDQCMAMTEDQLKSIVKLARRRLGKSTKSNVKTFVPSDNGSLMPDFKKKPLAQEMSEAVNADYSEITAGNICLGPVASVASN